MRTSSVNRSTVNATLRGRFGSTVTRQQLKAYQEETGINVAWIRRDESLRVGRGVYRIPGGSSVASTVTTKAAKPVPAPRVQAATPMVTSNDAPSFAVTADAEPDAVTDRLSAIAHQASQLAAVPAKLAEFVPFGDYDMVLSVIRSARFFPIFTTGLSGNGKTLFVEQACAATGREYIRCNITMETDEDDLLGGFRLKNGETVFEVGPVIVAMLRGAVLLLDEIDLASPKIMCLQPVLEGKPITLKKLGITIAPQPGFTVFATANTKGRGSDDGKFVGTGLLNEAFLERFPVTVEQEYPSVTVEKKILAKTFVAAGYELTAHAVTFFDTLARWAETIRGTYAEGGIEDLISTRRLVHIVKAYGIFGDDAQALGYCVNRFDPKVKDAFIDLYNKLAPDTATPSNVGSLDGSLASNEGF